MATTRKSQGRENIYPQIVIKAPQRSTSDVTKWRTALRSADMGRPKQLFDLYEDLLIDGVLSDAVEKRIAAITNSELAFTNLKGEKVQEMIDLIDTLAFEDLLTCIMQKKFWGRAAGEFDFSNGFGFNPIPFKHISLETQSILLNDSDSSGISYLNDDFLLVLGNQRDRGLYIKTAPFTIWKRGGFGDYAQWLEIFGMPQRIGKYSSYDTQSRQLLEEALSKAGSAPWLVIPKESDVETVNNTGNGSSGTSYNDFRKACNEEMLITVLGQTLTTVQGDKGARSLGEVHKQVEESKNKADMRYTQRVLNAYVKPILIKRGFPAEGNFVFPEAAEPLTVDELVSLSTIIKIPTSYIYDKHGIPRPKDGEETAGKQPALLAEPKDKNEPDPKKKDKEVNDFFVEAPAKPGAEIKHFIQRLKRNITGKTVLADNYSININKLIKRAIRELYYEEQQQSALVNKNLFEATNTPLQTAINRELLYVKDSEFIKQFRENTAVFAAFKNHLQTKEIVALLHDEEGNLRSFSKFKKLALQISEKYNVSWLQTEYNTAVRAARSAANFKKFQETADLYPNLEYVRSSATTPRISHEQYAGTILPINHEWWKTHMPPSDWNCQCSVRQTDKEITSVPGEEFVNSAFQNNAGESASFVNIDETPFYKHSEEELRDKIEKEGVRLHKEILKEKRKETLSESKKSVGKMYTNPDVNFKIGLTVKGIKEAINNPISDPIAKLDAITQIDMLLKTAKYVGVQANTKADKKPHILRYHYFETAYNSVEFIIIVEENIQGKYNLYTIVDKQKTAE